MPTQQELKQAWTIDKSNYGSLAYLFYVRNQPPMPLKKVTSNLEVELCFNRQIPLVRFDSVKLPFNITLAKLGNPFQYKSDSGTLIDCTLIDYTQSTFRFSITIDGSIQIVELPDSINSTVKLVMKTPPLISQNILVSELSKNNVMAILTDFMLLNGINTSPDLIANPTASSLDTLRYVMSQLIDSVHD